MIVLVITFIAATGQSASYQFVEGFPSISACEARFATGRADIESLRAAAEARLGQPLSVVARCVALGRPA